MGSTEKSKPPTRPQRTSERKQALGIALVVVPACVVLITGMVLAVSQRELSTSGQRELGIWLAAAGAVIMVGIFLTLGSDSERTNLWKYVDHLEKSKAVTEAALETMEKETRNYRVAMRAAQIRASQTIIDAMTAETDGDTPPKKHDY
jgi:hypothetical protein